MRHGFADARFIPSASYAASSVRTVDVSQPIPWVWRSKPDSPRLNTAAEARLSAWVAVLATRSSISPTVLARKNASSEARSALAARCRERLNRCSARLTASSLIFPTKKTNTVPPTIHTHPGRSNAA
jgi:hypothetical protein